jgi:predicted DCC family thiol-disulfide oxidoreductase YuxK
MVVDRSHPIILYDGVCGLCNRAVQFVIAHDRARRFKFAALQGAFAGQILGRHRLESEALNTVCLIMNADSPDEKLITRSDAAIAVLREIGGTWRFLAVGLTIIPKFMRDWGYGVIARHRYRIFGKYDACPLPKPEDANRFLND